ncbi:hypothetical protein [Acidaminococcus massiliensis]|jgi:DNA-binding XRE family transcriptional regulator|uniref:hypothetical protein n=1 Tax=Acidaminococcus massiliensis TaxID=1852375 RepID=UPI0020539532|nr:hypothetical protein [Acidaminococcus massiliensis]DAR24895.1 MAG TPA: helix-turn-helix protein [Caudoviricetes sp.]
MENLYRTWKGTRVNSRGKHEKIGDSYVDRSVSSKLEGPIELIDKDVHIKMLQQDVEQLCKELGLANSRNTMLKKQLAILQNAVQKEGEKPSVPELRAGMGMNMAELSRATGIDYQNLAKKETGNLHWSDRDKHIICEFFKLKIQDIDWERIR